MKDILQKLQHRRLIIFDPLTEYEDGLIFYDFLEWCDYLESKEEPLHFRHILRFDNQQDYFLALEVAYQIGDLLLIIEEVTNFANERSVDKTFDTIVRFGRHQGVSLIGITQRFANVPRLLTSQMDIIISFVQTEPRDIQYICMVVGQRGESIKDLAPYKYKIFFL